MKNNFKLTTILLVMVFLMTSIFTASTAFAQQNSTLDSILDEGKLKAGIMLDFPPCGFYDDDGNPAGMEVEVAERMAEMLGVELEIVETPGPSRIPALKAGKVDVVFGTLAITPARAKAVSFTRPYIYNSQWVIAKKDSSIEKFEDIKGKTIGTVSGTTPETNLISTVENWENAPETKSFSSNADVLMALRQNKVDAIAEAQIWFTSQIEKKYPDEFKLVGPPFYHEFCGAAVRTEDQQLLNWLDTALWKMIVLTDEMDELNQEYYNTSLPEEVKWGLK